MKYIIEQNPETNYYHLKDTETGGVISLSKYQVILGVIDDKFVIVGKPWVGGNLYGLVTIDGELIVDMLYDAIYVQGSRIYCCDDEVVNEMTLLIQYVWHNRKGEYFSNEPYMYSDLDIATIKDNGKNTSDGKQSYKQIDCYGRTVREFQGYSPIPNLTYEDCERDEWGHVYHKKWRKLWGLLEDDIVNSTIYRKISFPCGLTFRQLEIETIHNKFFLLYRSGYNSEGHWVKTHYCIADENCKVLYFDLSGFSVNENMFHDSLVINNQIIINALGETYNIPEGYEFAYNSDKNGFIEIYKEGKRGYMNNRGEVVIPTIFEKKEPYHHIDEDYFDSLKKSTDDAFEGDSSARWNID